MDYQCEEMLLGDGICADCKHFLWDRDKCREDSFIAKIYRMLNLSHERPHFEKRGPLAFLIFENTKYRPKG